MRNNGILIIGESGSGKSSSFRTLNPEETFVINCVGKQFPFREKGYKRVDISKGPPSDGNLLESDDFKVVMKTIEFISSERSEIKTLVIDDASYLFTNFYMAKAMEKGYDKYTQLGHMFWQLGMITRKVREDLVVFVVMHSEESMDSEGGRYINVKTLGKLVSSTINFPGLFTTVLLAQTRVSKSSGIEYGFITGNDGSAVSSIAKSPIEMFEDMFIPNDLNLVRTKYLEYYND